MSSPFDIKHYLDRIGYEGPRAVNLDTLGRLLAAHINAIHFENIDVLLGRPIRLDLANLQDKLVRERRGGYCFEQATLFDAALRTLGFETAARAARVTLVVPPHAAPRTHEFLIVTLPQGKFVVDPGCGGLVCRAPIPLDGAEVVDDADRYRIETTARGRILKVESDGRTIAAWSCGVDDDYPVDFEVGNHWTSTHPASPFRDNLMLRAIVPGGRVTVMNRDVAIRRGGGVERVQLADRAALRKLLWSTFGFDCPEVDTLQIPAIPEWN